MKAASDMPRRFSFGGMYRYLNLALVVLYPLSWGAPLLRAGLLPLFGLQEVSVMTGVATLWQKDAFLALIVFVFAFAAPMVKTLGLACIHWLRPAPHVPRWLAHLGRLAMADVFLIALYVTLAKGIGVGRVETAWGLYLFTFCVLASIWIGWCTERDAERSARSR